MKLPLINNLKIRIPTTNAYNNHNYEATSLPIVVMSAVITNGIFIDKQKEQSNITMVILYMKLIDHE